MHGRSHRDRDLFVLASCAARLANNSCLLEQPVAAKILLMVGEVSSSSMVEREELDVVGLADEREAGALVADKQGA